MYEVEKQSAVLENAAGFTRLDGYTYDPLGYVYTLGKQTSCFPKRCMSRNVGALCQALKGGKNSVGRRI